MTHGLNVIICRVNSLKYSWKQRFALLIVMIVIFVSNFVHGQHLQSFAVKHFIILVIIKLKMDEGAKQKIFKARVSGDRIPREQTWSFQDANIYAVILPKSRQLSPRLAWCNKLLMLFQRPYASPQIPLKSLRNPVCKIARMNKVAEMRMAQ